MARQAPFPLMEQPHPYCDYPWFMALASSPERYKASLISPSNSSYSTNSTSPSNSNNSSPTIESYVMGDLSTRIYKSEDEQWVQTMKSDYTLDMGHHLRQAGVDPTNGEFLHRFQDHLLKSSIKPYPKLCTDRLPKQSPKPTKKPSPPPIFNRDIIEHYRYKFEYRDDMKTWPTNFGDEDTLKLIKDKLLSDLQLSEISGDDVWPLMPLPCCYMGEDMDCQLKGCTAKVTFRNNKDAFSRHLTRFHSEFNDAVAEGNDTKFTCTWPCSSSHPSLQGVRIICYKELPAQDLVAHVLKVHLKDGTHRCKLCGYLLEYASHVVEHFEKCPSYLHLVQNVYIPEEVRNFQAAT